MAGFDDIKAKQFADMLFREAQQEASRLRGLAIEKTSVRGEAVQFDTLDPSGDMDELTVRHGDTDNEDMVFNIRWAVMRFYKKSHWTDKPDELETQLGDLSSPAMSNLVMLGGRKIDSVFIAAFNAATTTGKTLGSTDALPASQIIEENAITGSNQQITKEKILRAKRIMDAAEVPENDRYFVWNAIAVEQLLQDSSLTSSDFRTIKALESGDLGSFLGFKFIRSELLPKSGNIRSCFAWQKQGMGLAFVEQPFGRISERPDKNYLTQAYFRMGLGACRIMNTHVVEVQCDESA